MSGTDAPAGGGQRDAPPENAVIADALRRLAGDPAARITEQLIPALADDDERVREAAAGLLGRTPDTTEVLRSFLVHCRGLAPWLRERATAAIMRIRCDIVDPLARLMQDDDPDIRAGAMIMASGCGDPRIVPRVIEIFLGTDDWWVRGVAAETLGRFPCPEVRRALLSRIDDPVLRASVIPALGNICDREASACLLGCLSDPDRGTRAAALDALAPREDPEVYAALQKVALGDADRAVREKALAILEDHRPATEPYLRDLAAACAALPACPSEAPELTMERDAR